MRGEVETFESGWTQVNIRLRADEIDQLVDILQRIKREGSHAHLRSMFESTEPGLADVEISLQGPEEADNMLLE